MKRLLFCALVLALALSLAINCFAAGREATLSDGKGGPGQTVYLTLELTESVEGSAIGIQCQYDTELLEALPELCSWGQEGLISAFDEGNKGVWASEKTQTFNGKLCVLAFRIREDVAFDKTEVTCTLVIKDGATVKLDTTQTGVISCQCTHSYGPWESAGNTYHTRTCSLCGGKNTQTHSWDQGVNETQQNGQILLVKTCTVCNAKHAVDVTATEQDHSGSPIVGDSGEDHDHSFQVETQPEHDHDHDGVTDEEHSHAETENDPVTIWIVLLVPVLLIAFGVVYLKKK